MNLVIRIMFYFFVCISLFSSAMYLLSFFVYRKMEKLGEFKVLPKVSVIIPAFNEEETIGATIESVRGLDYPIDKLEIIVIDDGSKDRTYELAKKYASRHVKIFTKANGGKASAMNYAIRKAKGEFIVSMDADSYISKNALKEMIPFFVDEEVMAVTASMVIDNPEGFWGKLQQMEYSYGIFLRKAFSFLEAVHVTPGPFSMYRKKFFEEHGLYDEHNITEDTEIALRIQSNGYKIRSCIPAVVRTSAPTTFSGLFYQRRRWYTGFIDNVIKYRKLFHPSYGELGIFILPMSLISILIAFFLTGYFIFTSLDSLYSIFSYLSMTGYDIFQTPDLRFFLISLWISEYLTDPLLILGLFNYALFILTLVYVKKRTKEKTSSIFGFFVFILFYLFAFTFWWSVSIFNVIFLKNRGWGKKEVLSKNA